MLLHSEVFTHLAVLPDRPLSEPADVQIAAAALALVPAPSSGSSASGRSPIPPVLKPWLSPTPEVDSEAALGPGTWLGTGQRAGCAVRPAEHVPQPPALPCPALLIPPCAAIPCRRAHHPEL